MKIEVTIEISEDGRYGAPLARRVMTLEAATLPSTIGHLAGDIANQTIAEAEDKVAQRKLKEEAKTSPEAPLPETF